jgi:hypothetical protein
VILLFTVLIQLILFAIIMILLNTPGTRAAFASAGMPPAADGLSEAEDRPRRRYEGYDEDDDYGSAPRKSPPETGIKPGFRS